MIHAISSNQAQWNNFIKDCYHYDFYHTADYHRLAESEGEGDGVLLAFNRGQYFIGLPLIIRPIYKDAKLSGEQRYDATSVYGYAGPVASHQNLPKDFVISFQKSLKQYCIKNRIISVFSRLHTLWDQRGWLEGLGKIEDLGKTVSIDLTLPLEKQRAKFRKSNKSEINQLRRTARCRLADTRSDVDEYIDIYLENMRRVNAADRYFFDRDYFYNLLDAKDFECFIMLVENEQQTMAGAMFTVTKDIIQYHLAGTRETYLKLTPMKLILDEIRIKATNRGLKYFHLGGGVGSAEDSLFRFKSGFSDTFHTFSVWKWIVDEAEYQQLIGLQFGNDKIISDYFPLYRLNNKRVQLNRT